MLRWSWVDIYSISVQPGPLGVAGGDKASVLLQWKRGEIGVFYGKAIPSYLSAVWQ